VSARAPRIARALRAACISFAAPAAALLLPRAAWACAVCGFGEDQSRIAYIATTALLSALPIGLLAGLLIFLRRATRTRRRTPR